MIEYKVQVRLSSGRVTWQLVLAQSMAAAEELGAAYGEVLMVIRA